MFGRVRGHFDTLSPYHPFLVLVLVLVLVVPGVTKMVIPVAGIPGSRDASNLLLTPWENFLPGI